MPRCLPWDFHNFFIVLIYLISRFAHKGGYRDVMWRTSAVWRTCRSRDWPYPQRGPGKFQGVGLGGGGGGGGGFAWKEPSVGGGGGIISGTTQWKRNKRQLKIKQLKYLVRLLHETRFCFHGNVQIPFPEAFSLPQSYSRMHLAWKWTGTQARDNGLKLIILMSSKND